MARPNRKSQEFWFDTFADFPLDEQAAALKILEQVHRLALRETKQAKAETKPPKGETNGQGSLPIAEGGQ